MDPLLVVVVLGVLVAAIATVLFLRRRAGSVGSGAPTTTLDRPAPSREPVSPDRTTSPVDPPAQERLVPQDDAASSDEPASLDDIVEKAEEPAAEPEPAVKPTFRDRLGRARDQFAGYFGSVLSRDRVDEETWEELEEALIRADVGVELTTQLLVDLRARAKGEGITEAAPLLEELKVLLKERLAVADRSLRLDPDTINVWLFVGVNGVGKTTSIGKVARRYAGMPMLMAAGDTFRAAAAEQLETWADRTGAEIVRGNEGADPSSVVFDGIKRAEAKGIELVLADTAGRLHNKSNLMDELGKVRRVAGKEPGNVTEVLLVIDATTGQNGLVQAAVFTEAVEVTGVVLTKLDGSAKGGIVLAIQAQLGIPVKLVGLGEKAEDLVDFDHEEFVDALFDSGPT